MKRILAAGFVALTLAAGVVFQYPRSLFQRKTPAQTVALAPVALPDIGPAIEPLEPIKPPAPWHEVTLWKHWPSCSARPLVQQQEDAALEAVLVSAVEDDELFGGTEMRMEAAECASRRWRMEGR